MMNTNFPTRNSIRMALVAWQTADADAVVDADK